MHYEHMKVFVYLGRPLFRNKWTERQAGIVHTLIISFSKLFATVPLRGSPSRPESVLIWVCWLAVAGAQGRFFAASDFIIIKRT